MLTRIVMPFIVFIAQSGMTSDASESIQFHKRQMRQGDVSLQSLRCDLNLDMSIQQSGQIVESRKQDITRQQRRELTIMATAKRAPLKARVRYLASSIELKVPNLTATKSNQPVAGKTYSIERTGQKLTIRYPNGEKPPEEEIAIVAANMQAFGLPNPIAQFFDGRRIEIGQTIDLPTELAQELLGFQDTVGSVSSLRMKLIGKRNLNNKACAIFEITLIAKDEKQAGLDMTLGGKMLLEIDSCRAVAVELTGPVRVAELYGPENGKFTVSSEGELKVAVQANYRQAR